MNSEQAENIERLIDRLTADRDAALAKLKVAREAMEKATESLDRCASLLGDVARYGPNAADTDSAAWNANEASATLRTALDATAEKGAEA